MMDVKADDNRIHIKSLVYYTARKWWLYFVILILTAVVVFIWQTFQIKQTDMQQQDFSITDEEQQQLDAFFIQQGKAEILNQYGINSIYMNIDPYNETCCTYLLYIRNSEMASQMVFDIEKFFEDGLFAQKAAELLQIHNKYMDELICYELLPMDQNEYIAQIMILIPDNDHAVLYEQVCTQILQTNILNKYEETLYEIDKNIITRIDKELLLEQQRYVSSKTASDNVLATLKSALNERQLSVLNNIEIPLVKTAYDFGAMIKMVLASCVFSIVLVMLYFVQNSFICINEDVEQAFDIRCFSLKGQNRRQNLKTFHQLFGYIEHYGKEKVYFCEQTERFSFERQFAYIIKESNVEIAFTKKLVLDYKEADLKKEITDFVICMKKGKMKLKELQELCRYCNKMNYRVLGIVLF